MSDQVEQKSWLETIVEGGLPQVVAGPAGKAISRLIGAGIEIPAAWLEQKAQAIRDETEARSVVMTTLAGKSAELGLENPELLGRGLDSLLGKAYREQENREAVAAETIEELKKGPEPTGEGPSDDWMNVFEGCAARASSAELRSLFSKVLAGEIRKPGEFSLSALHLVSILDAQLASLVEQIAPFVWDGNVIVSETVKDTIPYLNLLHLEEVGFITLGSGFLSITKDATDLGFLGFESRGIGVMAQYNPNHSQKFNSYGLSRGGKELIGILDVVPNAEALGKAIWNTSPKRVLIGTVARTGEGWALLNERDIPNPSAAR